VKKLPADQPGDQLHHVVPTTLLLNTTGYFTYYY
jgi:hypothetical protein